MGHPTGFMDYVRKGDRWRPPAERVGDFRDLHLPLAAQERREQAARCMDCGVPFCQSEHGCPLCNLIPEWNDKLYHGRLAEAYALLASTNPFPEFTSRVCPALCEGACSLTVIDKATTNRDNERFIVDWAFEHGLVDTSTPAETTGYRVGIVGSGPAGLAAAEQLNRLGHAVTVFERSNRFGGLLMYGIPNMKLEKHLVERRVDILRQRGVHFIADAEVGRNVDVHALYNAFDALLLACGTSVPRDLDVPGRTQGGIHFAMSYLTGATQQLLDGEPTPISAAGKRVVVIGGGDTGNDCIGTAIRQGARSVVNLELLPEAPTGRAAANPWPQWPRVSRTDYGHNEAKARFGQDPRHFCTLTQAFLGDDLGHVRAVRTARVQWSPSPTDGRATMAAIPGSEETFDADLVLLALGFVGPEQRLAEQLGLRTGEQGTFSANLEDHATSVPGVFAAGDCRRGQSLVVWAMREGRQAAAAIDRYLLDTAAEPPRAPKLRAGQPSRRMMTPV